MAGANLGNNPWVPPVGVVVPPRPREVLLGNRLNPYERIHKLYLRPGGAAHRVYRDTSFYVMSRLSLGIRTIQHHLGCTNNNIKMLVIFQRKKYMVIANKILPMININIINILQCLYFASQDYDLIHSNMQQLKDKYAENRKTLHRDYPFKFALDNIEGYCSIIIEKTRTIKKEIKNIYNDIINVQNKINGCVDIINANSAFGYIKIF
eukprot:TRINITY_DN17946_c0_g1_i1.p1 TRINITY_DN17946_c0_g1~~TRINITY_DN17946_c0_g1_i1.p1  ORF type:complete len:208 (-),score=5.92 TRINITY_DN17946_c0_g1_i1:150-773(-)